MYFNLHPMPEYRCSNCGRGWPNKLPRTPKATATVIHCTTCGWLSATSSTGQALPPPP